MKFNITKGNLQLRSCNDMLLNEGEHTTAEIVKKDNNTSCYTILYWDKYNNSVTFVSDRAFTKDVNPKTLMKLIKKGFKLLNT